MRFNDMTSTFNCARCLSGQGYQNPDAGEDDVSIKGNKYSVVFRTLHDETFKPSDVSAHGTKKDFEKVCTAANKGWFSTDLPIFLRANGEKIKGSQKVLADGTEKELEVYEKCGDLWNGQSYQESFDCARCLGGKGHQKEHVFSRW